MSKSKKRNIIMGSLCAVVLLMAVGYAAFQTVLNIQGISNITSRWNVKITNVESKNIVGTASNNGDPSFEELSATFKTSLQTPGDSIEYDITVSNAGSLDAKLDEIILSDTNNPAIKFTSSGMNKGDVIKAGNIKVLTVKVEYLSTTSEQPTNTSSTLTVDLDYSQATGNTPSGPSMTTEDLKSLAVKAGDGLYIDTYENGRYVYKGANPNNYITFNNEEWQIIAVEADGTLKIVKSKSIGNLAWDITNSNNWSRPSFLNTYLGTDYYESLSNGSKEKIQNHIFDIGSVISENVDLKEQIKNEKEEQWIGNVGLISLSDYIRANSNAEWCGNLALNNINYTKCKTTVYIGATDYFWTITPYANSDKNVFIISVDGSVSYGIYYSGFVFPAVYLNSDITLTGEGAQSNPYRIAQ